jgi:hypothetical protein
LINWKMFRDEGARNVKEIEITADEAVSKELRL